MTETRSPRTRRAVLVGPADLQSGERRIVEIRGKQIGIFNVLGHYYALHNRCPHMAGNLCAGPVTGTTLPTDSTEFKYGRVGEIIRCAWHGWEFEITTGVSLVDPNLRAKTYPVTVENGNIILHF